MKINRDDNSICIKRSTKTTQSSKHLKEKKNYASGNDNT